MSSLTNDELINLYGGAFIYAAPTYALFMRLCKFASNLINSLIR